MIAEARKAGKSAYMYNNEIMIVDLPGHRLRTFPWQLWRTNYAYPLSRHAGLQGSLSWYSITSYFGSDPWSYANGAHTYKSWRPLSCCCAAHTLLCSVG
jgi:hypothetical protein